MKKQKNERPTVKNDLEKIAKQKGKRLLLGGHGIIDGMKSTICKKQLYKIQGMGDKGLRLKKYRAKGGGYLPFHMMKQEYRIISDKEFKTLPVYA